MEPTTLSAFLSTLDSSSPEELSHLPEVCKSFQTFFQKNNPAECAPLLPPQWAVKNCKIDKPQNSSRARSFFETQTENRLHQDRLVKVVNRLNGEFSEHGIDAIWSERGEIFGDENGQASGISRRSRLAEGRKKIGKEVPQYTYASRFSLIYLGHEIDACSDGRRRNASVTQLAKEIKTEVGGLWNILWRSSKYEYLLLEFGPGILLVLGENVNNLWEDKLTLDEVELFVRYLREERPEFCDKVAQLNEAGGNFALAGLYAYGSNDDHLAFMESRLRMSLVKHCKGTVRLPWTDPGRDPRVKSEETRKRKRQDKTKQYNLNRQEKANHCLRPQAEPLRQLAPKSGNNVHLGARGFLAPRSSTLNEPASYTAASGYHVQNSGDIRPSTGQNFLNEGPQGKSPNGRNLHEASGGAGRVRHELEECSLSTASRSPANIATSLPTPSNANHEINMTSIREASNLTCDGPKSWTSPYQTVAQHTQDPASKQHTPASSSFDPLGHHSYENGDARNHAPFINPPVFGWGFSDDLFTTGQSTNTASRLNTSNFEVPSFGVDFVDDFGPTSHSQGSIVIPPMFGYGYLDDIH